MRLLVVSEKSKINYNKTLKDLLAEPGVVIVRCHLLDERNLQQVWDSCSDGGNILLRLFLHLSFLRGVQLPVTTISRWETALEPFLSKSQHDKFEMV